MDQLLKAVADLKINGTPQEEAEFKSFQRQMLTDIRKEELDVLKKLKDHHLNTLKHNIMVARDVVYIATQLNLHKDIIKSLKIAALLHDVGKLDIHEVILDLGRPEETLQVWEYNHPKTPLPDHQSPIKSITVRDVIKFKASKSDDEGEYIHSFEKWLKEKHLTSFLDKSIREYLNHHQDATRRILEKIGVNQEIVDYAASHHISYFDDTKKNKLPKECKIIEIADKFNALTQSEGIRHYVSSKSRTMALNIICNELKEEFEGVFHFIEKKTLNVLVKKYLPSEINNDLIPQVKKLFIFLNHHPQQVKSHLKETEKAIALIAVTLALSKEFEKVLDNSITKHLKYYETELITLISNSK